MQGGGRFHTMRDASGMDDTRQQAYDETQAARRANPARRHRARHRGGHAGWLRLGRRTHGTAHARDSSAATHATATAAPETTTTGAHHGSSHGESHGY